MKKLTVLITDKSHTGLLLLKEREQRSIAYFIQRAIDNLLIAKKVNVESGDD